MSEAKSTVARRRVGVGKPGKAHAKTSGEVIHLTDNPKGPDVELAEERYRLIEELAYFKAERRGFAPGMELQDWLEAEAEVDAMMKRG